MSDKTCELQTAKGATITLKRDAERNVALFVTNEVAWLNPDEVEQLKNMLEEMDASS